MKTYVLTVSEKFPATHPRRGELTGFTEAIKQGVKIHTIRANYPLWEKRIKEVEEGRARLSVRVWTGKPYNSPQKEICEFTSTNGVGVEKLTFSGGQFNCMLINGSYCFAEIDKTIAANDGLEFNDFYKWFEKYDLTEPMAIIHFSAFRYNN